MGQLNPSSLANTGAKLRNVADVKERANPEPDYLRAAAVRSTANVAFVPFRLSKKSVRLNPSACRFELRPDPLPLQKSVFSVNQRPLDLPFDPVT